MKGVTDPVLLAQLDFMQIACKLAMNSMFGVNAINTFEETNAIRVEGQLHQLHRETRTVGWSITRAGRWSNFVAQYAARLKGLETKYGDSVARDTPIVLRVDGALKTCRIDEIPNCTWEVREDGKEQGRPNVPLYVWSDDGFKRISSVIRHHYTEPLFRVFDSAGTVDVTKHHSLLLANGMPVTPENVRPETQLKFTTYSGLTTHCNVGEPSLWNKEDIELMAASMAGFHLQNNVLKESYNKEHLDEFGKRLPFFTFTRLSGNGVYCLCAGHSDIPKMLLSFRPLFRSPHGFARIPDFLLNGPMEHIETFIDVFFGGNTSTVLSVRGKELAMGIELLLSRLGRPVVVYPMRLEDDVFVVDATSPEPPPPRWQTTRATRIHLGGYHDYVYDIDTESGHFHVGPGRLVVHNTDSIFTMFPEGTLAENMELAKEIEEHFKEFFPEPMELNFEKFLRDFLVLRKKRYVGFMQPQNVVKTSGIASVRRDSCLAQAELIELIIHALYVKDSLAEACLAVIEMLQSLHRRDLSMHKLLYTRSFSKPVDEYSQKGPPPHVRLAWRLRDTRPELLQEGQRVEYIVCGGNAAGTKNKRLKVGERAELPDTVVNEGLEVDVQYYAEAIRSSAGGILEPILGDLTSTIFDLGERVRGGVTRKDCTIPSVFQKAGFRAQRRCEGCRVLVDSGETFCEHCRQQKDTKKVTENYVADLEDLGLKNYGAYRTCQECLHNRMEERNIACGATVCKVYWEREQFAQQLKRRASLAHDMLRAERALRNNK